MIEMFTLAVMWVVGKGECTRADTDTDTNKF